MAALVALLAWASYVTTGRYWDSGYKQGEYRIHVRGPDGKPIPGAALQVYEGGTKTPAYEYPFSNHSPAAPLVADGSGRITAIQRMSGLQFGSYAWDLFWVIPLGATWPQYDCEFTAPGFKPFVVEVSKLFDDAQPSDDGERMRIRFREREVELRIFEYTAHLKP